MILDRLDHSFIKDNKPWVHAWENINWQKIESIETLIRNTENLIIKYPQPNNSIKTAIFQIYEEVLRRYPAFFGYWKKYTSTVYQLDGLERSIQVLSKAVEAFPHSVELWTDYLGVIIANNNNDYEFIKTIMDMAIDLVGHQFWSHPVWDKYLEFESSRSNWKNVLDIYLKISEIPLHQYGRYYTGLKALFEQHTEIKCPEGFMIDIVFLKTQKLVNDIWIYESKIQQNFFNLCSLPEVELTNWDQYLDFMMNDPRVCKKLLESVFQRCLIPCKWYEYFWDKYVKWLENSFDFDKTLEAYQEGILSLPPDSKSFRIKYLSFLETNIFTGKEQYSKLYMNALFTASQQWPSDTSFITKYLAIFKSLEYPSNIDEEDKKILAQQTSYAKKLQNIISIYFEKPNQRQSIQLLTMLNDVNISIIIIELIKINWLVLKNIIQARKYFNQFSKNSQLRNSASFWLTYYKFEKTQKNLTKLNKFVSQLGNEIILPITIMNDILIDYKNFYLANCDISEYESRLSLDTLGFDPLLHLDCKINQPGWNPYKNQELKEWHKSKEFKENGHPGLIVEKPQITSTIIENNSSRFKDRVQSIPTFRNLEKLNQGSKYEDFLADYLKEN